MKTVPHTNTTPTEVMTYWLSPFLKKEFWFLCERAVFDTKRSHKTLNFDAQDSILEATFLVWVQSL